MDADRETLGRGLEMEITAADILKALQSASAAELQEIQEFLARRSATRTGANAPVITHQTVKHEVVIRQPQPANEYW
jgi:hypothetical protein